MYVCTYVAGAVAKAGGGVLFLCDCHLKWSISHSPISSASEVFVFSEALLLLCNW